MNMFDIATCCMLCVRSKCISCVVPDFSIQSPIYLLADFLLKKSVDLMCCQERERSLVPEFFCGLNFSLSATLAVTLTCG